jgi:hypothetical protein
VLESLMVEGVPATCHEMRSQPRRRGTSKLAVVAIPGLRHQLSYLDALQSMHASDSRLRRRKRALTRTNPGRWGTHPRTDIGFCSCLRPCGNTTKSSKRPVYCTFSVEQSYESEKCDYTIPETLGFFQPARVFGGVALATGRAHSPLGRAGYAAVTAENATIARLRTEDGPAAFALIKEKTGIRRHHFGPLMTANGACDRRLQHRGFPPGIRLRRHAACARTPHANAPAPHEAHRKRDEPNHEKPRPMPNGGSQNEEQGSDTRAEKRAHLSLRPPTKRNCNHAQNRHQKRKDHPTVPFARRFCACVRGLRPRHASYCQNYPSS